MADAPDKESKTEEATEKKIQDAVEKGNVPFSREAATLASLLGMAGDRQLLPRKQRRAASTSRLRA